MTPPRAAVVLSPNASTGRIHALATDPKVYGQAACGARTNQEDFHRDLKAAPPPRTTAAVEAWPMRMVL